MSSLDQQIRASSPLRQGSKGDLVEAMQEALRAHGYRVTPDGDFGPATDHFVRQFQTQHGLTVDGVVGDDTAALLDAPNEQVIKVAKPLFTPEGWPHDDSASLIAFYGKPWEQPSLLVHVDVPFAMTYRDDNGVLLPIHSIQIHHKCADALSNTLHAIAGQAEHDPSILRRVSHFSGSFNYRAIRGSSRLSCHSFGAAVDFDAEHLPLAHGVPAADMPQAVVDAFRSFGAFWGGDYRGRKDPMHFQWSHE